MLADMYSALDKLEQAATARRRAEIVWRAAIREALASRVSIEMVAAVAHATVDEILAALNETAPGEPSRDP